MDVDDIISQHVLGSREIVLGGYMVRAVNATVCGWEIAGQLAIGRPFGVVYFDSDGVREWWLRSVPGGVDVAAVAELYGGCGLRQRATFQQVLSADLPHGM